MESSIYPSVENRVEGPWLKVEITLSKEELLKQMPPNNMPQVARRWIYEQIERNIPEGEVKNAFHLAYEELKQRTKQRTEKGIDIIGSPTLVSGSERYAFRGILRKSDDTPVINNPEATLSKLDDNLFNFGIDAPGSERDIMPGILWDMHAFPTIFGLENRSEDMTEIFIYRNKPFVLPTKEGDKETTLVDMFGEKRQVNVAEALEKKYPTLRDLLVGQIEVRFV